MEMLNRNINTEYYETHASISLDGRKLLFTSDRPGGQGALDIWMSERSGDGDWGPAVNIGPKVNSFYNEETPFFTENGLKIFFSSQGHATMGGFDIFVSEKLPDATWSFPENLGYPISSSDDDLFYVPRRNGMRGYFSTIHDSLDTGRNIYALVLTPSEDVRIGVRQLSEQPDTEPAKESITATTETGEGETPRDTLELGLTVPRQDTTGAVTRVPGPAGPDAYYVLNSLLFDFDSDLLTDETRQEADRVFEVLMKHPDLELELTGHTDAIGDDAYNRQLSYRRANAVAGYLTGKGIEESRLHVTGVGESRPIAINMYEDGTDCPDGRRLNRHVSLRLRNLQDEHIEVAEVFVPEHLQPRSEKRYTVLLINSEHMLDTIPDEVSGEQTALIITDESFLYTAGHFNLKPDAMKYLNEVIDNGYPDASMMERKELERLIADLSQGDMTLEASFTIQIMALKNPVDVSYFKPLEVTKYAGKDGFHRYIHGEYEGIDEALKELPSFKEMGYHDAFIMSVLRYSKTTE
jgi:outer membrane protein OmpA-like peptidoglycan-associated protein